MGGSVRMVSESITRQANTDAYTAGDVISDATPSRFTFSGVSQSKGQGGIIQNASLISSANKATKLDAELWLFAVDITDLEADNSAWDPSDAQLKNLVGVIDFATGEWKAAAAGADAAGNAACFVSNVGIAFSVDILYGVLVARNAYTPVSGEVLTINLTSWR